MKKIEFVTLRHNHAPEKGDGHIWLPSSETTAMALLKQQGIEISWIDENLKSFDAKENQTIAISLVGSPYIPEAIRFIKRARAQTNGKINFIIGGQITEYLSPKEFSTLFGIDSVRGNDYLKQQEIVPGNEENISLQPIYEMISDQDMKKYLSTTFSLYLSQGCKFACSFCAAVRSKKGKKVVEQYRNIDLVKTDLSYLVERAKKLNIKKLNIYISNLDAFQTPLKLEEFADSIEEILKDNPEFKFDFRCLVTVDSTINLCEKHPELAKKLIKIGFTNIGIGIDGMTPEVWKKTGKAHNFSGRKIDGKKYKDGEKTMKSIQLSHKYGFTPEALMVFGHMGADTEKSMQLALDFTEDVVGKFGVIPRPHVSKEIVPGNSAWDDPKNESLRKLLIQNPDLFQALDFTAEASPFTHPNKKFRTLVNKYYNAICNIKSAITPRVKAIEHSFNGVNIEISKTALNDVKRENMGQYDL